MLKNVPAMAPTCAESVTVITCILGKSVSAAQFSHCLQELEYPAIVCPAQIIFLFALNMELAPVEFVSVKRY